MTIKDGAIFPPFEDVQIQCVDCGTVFLFSASEQDFFYDRKLVARKRCKICTEIRHRRYPPADFAKSSQGAADG